MSESELHCRVRVEREKRNRDIASKAKAGHYFASFDAQASFFPARPVIKKDKRELARLYGETKT